MSTPSPIWSLQPTKLSHNMIYWGSGMRACSVCAARETEVVALNVSRRCTGQFAKFWPGQCGTTRYAWSLGDNLNDVPLGTKGSDYWLPEFDLCADSESVVNTDPGRMPASDVKPHVMGHDPEIVDWAAHRAFMREIK